MFVRPYRRASALALGVFVAGLTACGIPRPGPSMNEIFAGSVLREGDAYIVAVGDRVNRAANVPVALGFSDSLARGGDARPATPSAPATPWRSPCSRTSPRGS